MTVDDNKSSRIVAKQIVWNGENHEACDTQSVRLSFKRQQVIGAGSFGVVKTVNITKISDASGFNSLPLGGLKLAMKTVTVRRRENRELTILKQLHNQNIVNLRFYFYTKDKARSELQLNLLFDIQSTSLYELIDELYMSGGRMSSSSLVNYGSQLLQGLQYLHNKGIAHRDIKPRNLLVEVETGNLQICDLGSACRVGGDADLNPYICSRFYRAPELLLGSTHYTLQVDVWSFGLVLGEMGLLSPLVPGEDTGDQIGQVMELVGPPSYTDLVSMGLENSGLRTTVLALADRIQGECLEEKVLQLISPVHDMYPGLVDILCSTLQYSPARRLTPTQLLNQSFFKM